MSGLKKVNGRRKRPHTLRRWLRDGHAEDNGSSHAALGPMGEIVCTIDFETFYSDDFTLKKMSTEAYVRDPRFEAAGTGYQSSQGASGEGILVPTEWREQIWSLVFSVSFSL